MLAMVWWECLYLPHALHRVGTEVSVSLGAFSIAHSKIVHDVLMCACCCEYLDVKTGRP